MFLLFASSQCGKKYTSKTQFISHNTKYRLIVNDGQNLINFLFIKVEIQSEQYTNTNENRKFECFFKSIYKCSVCLPFATWKTSMRCQPHPTHKNAYLLLLSARQ